MSVEDCYINIDGHTYEVPREVYLYILELREEVKKLHEFRSGVNKILDGLENKDEKIEG